MTKQELAIEALKKAADAQLRWNEHEAKSNYFQQHLRRIAEKKRDSKLGSFSRNPTQRNFRAYVRAKEEYDKALATAPKAPDYNERGLTRKKAGKACAEALGVKFPKMSKHDDSY